MDAEAWNAINKDFGEDSNMILVSSSSSSSSSSSKGTSKGTSHSKRGRKSSGGDGGHGAGGRGTVHRKSPLALITEKTGAMMTTTTANRLPLKSPSKNQNDPPPRTAPASTKKRFSEEFEGWDDGGLDDDFLLQASQIGDKGKSQANRRNALLDEEIAEMTKQMDATDDDFLLNVNASGEKQTVQSTSLSSFAYNEIPAIPVPRAKNTYGKKTLDKPPSTNGSRSVNITEFIRVQAENKKLSAEKFKTIGELSFLRTEKLRLEKLVKEEHKRSAETQELKAKEMDGVIREREKNMESILAEREFLRQELQQMRGKILKLEQKTEPRKKEAEPGAPGLEKHLADKEPKLASNSGRKRKDEAMAIGIDESLLTTNSLHGIGSQAKRPRRGLRESGDLKVRSVRVQTNRVKPSRKHCLKLRHQRDDDIQNALGVISQVPQGELLLGQITNIREDSADESYLSKLLRVASVGTQSMVEQIKIKTIADLSEALLQDARPKSEERTKELVNCFEILVDFGKGCDKDSKEVFKAIFPILKNAFKTCNHSPMKEAICSLLRSLLEAHNVSEEEVGEILDVLKFFLRYAHQIETSLLLQIVQILKCSIAKFAHMICSSPDDQCFILHLCSAINFNLLNRSANYRLLSRSNDSDPLLALGQAFASFLSASLSLGSSESLCWIGSPQNNDGDFEDEGGTPRTPSLRPTCRWCHVDLTKSLALLSSIILRLCINHQMSVGLEPMNTSGEAADLYTTGRACILSLHELWTADGQQFLKHISSSHLIQRKYLWATKQLEKLKPCLNLPAAENSIIGDLHIICEDEMEMAEEEEIN